MELPDDFAEYKKKNVGSCHDLHSISRSGFVASGQDAKGGLCKARTLADGIRLDVNSTFHQKRKTRTCLSCLHHTALMRTSHDSSVKSCSHKTSFVIDVMSLFRRNSPTFSSFWLFSVNLLRALKKTNYQSANPYNVSFGEFSRVARFEKMLV